MTTSLVQLHCASLRSKSAYAAFGDFHEEHAELMGATTTYWCLKTMSKAGPDDHYVHRSICQQGRSCWESCDHDEESWPQLSTFQLTDGSSTS